MVKKVLSYAEEVVVKGKKEIKKEQIVAIKPEKQENINGEQDHWILV